jgi:serine/threonine protein kinase
LRSLDDCEFTTNIIGCDLSYEYIYILLDLAICDLSKLIKEYNIEEAHIKPLIFDLLNGVKGLHDKAILHIDLKPNNLLLKSNGHLILTDFGFSKNIREKNEIEMCLGTPGVSIYYLKINFISQ